MKIFRRIQKSEYKILATLLLAICLLFILIPYGKDPLKRRQKILNQNIDAPLSSAAPSAARVALLAHGKLASSFIKKVELPLSEEQVSDIKYVIWGNKDFGYFKTDKVEYDHSKYYLEVIPPTYKKPIHFCYQKNNGELVKLDSKTFAASPISLLENISLKIEGEFKQPFMLISTQFIPPKYSYIERSYLPTIVNKWGEIIWAHVPQNGKKFFRKYPIIRKTKKGEYGILFGEKASFFELFNYKGEILNHIDSKKALDPFVIHHDFTYLGDGKLLTLGHKLHYIRNLAPLNHSFLDPMQMFLSPTKLLSTTVDLVDLNTKTKKLLWDPTSYFSPLDPTKWAATKKHVNMSLRQLSGIHFANWKENAHIDFSHANSIEYYPGKGFLVSFRNLSKVVMLDETFETVLWTLGNEETDHFQTLDERHAFYHQHHAQLLPGNHVIMMDNHTAPPAPHAIGTRIIVYKLDETKRKAVAVWNYQPPPYYRVPNRGSAFVLKNTNVLAFYPASVGGMDHLIEVDRKTGKAIGHMQIYFTSIERKYSKRQLDAIIKKGLKPLGAVKEGGGNRAIPVYTLGKEQQAEKDLECQI